MQIKASFSFWEKQRKDGYALIYYAVLVMLWSVGIGLVMDDTSILYQVLDKLVYWINH